jgi:hypothetical protein
VPGQIVNVGATAMCPHGGQVSIVSSNTRVMLGGAAAATFSDTFTIAGCAFTVPGPKPQPCVKVQWLVPALRVLVSKQPVILQNSTGLCLSAEQIPQGPPNVVMTQLRVKAT